MRQEIRKIGEIGLMGLMGLIGLISLMGLTSCSSGSGEGWEPELPVEQGKQGTSEEPAEMLTPICFSGYEGENQEVNMVKRDAATRAGLQLNDAGVTAFTVWGYKNMTYDELTGTYDADASKMQTVFPGYAVEYQPNSAATTTTNSSNWEYLLAGHPTQSIKFWDWSAAAYRFYAVTGYTSHEPNTPNGPHEFSIVADATSTEGMNATHYFSRLWFSTGQLPTYADKQFGKPVQLEFLKPFCRVRLMFNYSYAEEGIRLEDICFKPGADYEAAEGDRVKIPLKGTFTVSYPLTGTETKESFTISNIDAPSRLEAFTEEYIPEGTEKWYTVLPNNTQGYYRLRVLVNGAERWATVPEQFMQWQPGYSYTYIFKITEEGGVEIELVHSAVADWTDLENEYSVYNW